MFLIRLIAVIIFLSGVSAAAESNSATLGSLLKDSGRARLSSPKSRSVEGNLTFSPLSLTGGTKLTVISPENLGALSASISKIVTNTHHEYITLFGDIPSFSTNIRLMDEDLFYLSTGAPAWTNAMYYRGQIIIPVNPKKSLDWDNINRSIRHEYMHAAIHALSDGHCPGWLDEGLAQWAEGDENPALKPALVKWLVKNPPVPLSLLQGGFTKLNSKMVPAAYAQSLYSTRSILDRFSFGKLKKYFDDLKNGEQSNLAFEQNFGNSEKDFESLIGTTFVSWAHRR